MVTVVSSTFSCLFLFSCNLIIYFFNMIFLSLRIYAIIIRLCIYSDFIINIIEHLFSNQSVIIIINIIIIRLLYLIIVIIIGSILLIFFDLLGYYTCFQKISLFLLYFLPFYIYFFLLKYPLIIPRQRINSSANQTKYLNKSK